MDSNKIVNLFREQAHIQRAKELEGLKHVDSESADNYLAGQAYSRKCHYNRKRLSTGR